MKINEHNEYILNENDIINILYHDGEIPSKIIIDDVTWVNKYNEMNELFNLNNKIDYEYEFKGSKKDYENNCINNWFMDKDYNDINVLTFLLDKCTSKDEMDRVNLEYKEYEKRDLTILLKFLIYFVDIIKDNKQYLGVGRGSSVSSYILYLIGIHKIDSLKYKLDIKEFLK